MAEDPSVILFTTDRPDFYLLEQIYDSATNPTGTVIPRPGSLVIDPGNDGLLQRVVSVNTTTHNSTYGPVLTSLARPIVEQPNPFDDNIVSIIDYGNSLFYLFYDTSETPTKLNIDKKVIVFGNDADMFEIVRYDTSLQQYVPISLYYDTDGNYGGTKVPLVVVEKEGILLNDVKVPTNCHTNHNITDNDVFHCNIYDYAGTLCGSFKLFAKRAVVNNNLDDNLIITNFLLESTQEDSNGDFYLYPDQDPLSLVINPTVIFNDGDRKIIEIDNETCFLTGFEGFTASYPGQEVNIVVKYYLESIQQAMADSLVLTGQSRMLVREKKVRVVDPRTNEYVLKILVVPKYNKTTGKWNLLFYLYTLFSNTVIDVTAYVTLSPAFDKTAFGVDQTLLMSLKVKDIYPDMVGSYTFQQPVVIRIAPYSYYERYIIRDTVGDTYGTYGVEAATLSRPVLYYDSTLGQYFIPTSKFKTKANVLEAFYYKMRPLYDNGLLVDPVIPSHFTIRDSSNGSILMSTPVALADWEQAFTISNLSTSNALVDNNCIVEFLKYEEQQYTVLFGAPVDVYEGVFA